MKKEKPKMPYITGEPEGLGRSGSEEIVEEEKRLSGGVRQKRTSEDIISDEPDPLQRLIEQEEGVHTVDGIESAPDNGGAEGGDNDGDEDEADENGENFEEATIPTQEQTDDSTRLEYSGTQSGSLRNTTTRDELKKPRGIGEHPAQKPHYKDKIGRATIRRQNPNA